MAKSDAQVLAKLDKPPAAHNFARCNHERVAHTARALVNLAVGFPQVSYQWAHKAIQITIADGIDEATSRRILEISCPESQWEDNLNLLNAFLDYNRERQFQGMTVYDEWCGNFIAGDDVTVPVRPTAVLRENGVLKPIFVVGWARNSMTYFQRRLLTSIYEDAIFSLTDFRSSPGEVLFFPKDGYGIRRIDRWNRDSYQRLDHSQLTEQVKRFVEARAQARSIIPTRLREIEAAKAAKKATRGQADKGKGGPAI